MKLAELTMTGFMEKTAGNDPVPGGGSVSALCGAIAASLAEMVAGLTIGRKKYEEVEQQMKHIAEKAANYRRSFIADIDADSDAYNLVFEAFKMPKESDEEKAVRSEKIESATKVAAEVPMKVARAACQMMEIIAAVAEKGNRNAITDAGVSMMCARTAALGALLNVRINLGGLKDQEYATRMHTEADKLENEAKTREAELLALVAQAVK